jgi:hypothetical protein
MRFLKSFAVVGLVGGLGYRGAFATDSGGYSDTCAEVNAELKVPQPFIPNSLIGVGIISE